MMRSLGLSSLLLAFVACSSTANTSADGGDAAIESKPDVGQPDANAPDWSDSDASAPDASDSDSNAPDGGGDGDGDGGPVSCDDVALDPVLGTARLGAAYRVVDSAVLPVTSWLPVAVVEQALPEGGTGLVTYGYNGDGRVHRLGVWPQLSAPDAANLAFDAVSQAHRTSQVVITPLLAATQGRLLAGYRVVQGVAFAGGGVSLFDTSHPEAGTRWLAAPGVEAVMGLGSYFLVGGNGLGAAAAGLGVYGVKADEATLSPGLAAKYPNPSDQGTRPGLMALTSNGLPVIGTYLDAASRHSVRLPEPSALMDALSGGSALDLAVAPELTQVDDVANLTSFGQGVAVLHAHEVRGILPVLGRLDHYPLSRPGGDAGTAIGAPVTMLSASDGCMVVSQLVPMSGGVNVIVGLWDRNGQRLVRLAAR
jgi:hypothetical protein